MDLSAAFDKVDHHILIKRLESTFGINGTALSWLKSYLENKTQSKNVNGIMSKAINLPFSVPQGSLLGASLYCEYTNLVDTLFDYFTFFFMDMLMTHNFRNLSIHPMTINTKYLINFKSAYSK